MKNTLKKILDENEAKFGADYGERKVNSEGIIFDFSGLGYHIRVDKVNEDEKTISLQ